MLIKQDVTKIHNDLTSLSNIYKGLEKKYGVLAINMMGGMKVSSFNAIYSLQTNIHLFLHTTEDIFFISKFKNNSIITEYACIDSDLSIKEILNLQNIDYSDDNNQEYYFERLCLEAKIDIPKNSLFNIKIKDQHIDCLWMTKNNILNLLFIMNHQSTKSVQATMKARNFELIALGKELLNGILDRNIFILDTYSGNVSRYKLEAGPKIRPYHIKWDNFKLDTNSISIIKEIFSYRNKPASNLKRFNEKIELKPTLIIVLSRLSDITPLAIINHKCPQVILIYTPQDKWVNHMAHRIKNQYSELGIDHIHLLETDQSGINIIDNIPKSLIQFAQINITPGTKSQATMLALWAIKHNIPTWSIYIDKLIQINHEKIEKEIQPLALQTRLKVVSEAHIKSEGWNENAKDWNDPFYNKMLEFMELIRSNNKQDIFMIEDISINGYKCINIKKYNNEYWKFTWPTTNMSNHTNFPNTIELHGGYWYEKVVTKAIYNLNKPGQKYDVTCGFEVSGAEKWKPMTERDVLVIAPNASLYMISCKFTKEARDNRISTKNIIEVKATAKTLGRFVIPMMCTNTIEEPYEKNGVYIFGWPTLCQPKELSKILNKAAQALY
jgi:hypothetical protein